MIRRPPTATLFPYTPLFRSGLEMAQHTLVLSFLSFPSFHPTHTLSHSTFLFLTYTNPTILTHICICTHKYIHTGQHTHTHTHKTTHTHMEYKYTLPLNLLTHEILFFSLRLVRLGNDKWIIDRSVQ